MNVGMLELTPLTLVAHSGNRGLSPIVLFDIQAATQGIINKSVSVFERSVQAAKQAAGDAVETMRTVVLKEKTISSSDPALPPVKVTEVLTPEQVARDCAGDMTMNPDGTISYRMPSQGGGCFIAGTLVHTKEGLKPIEQIKVGDYVLSKPEDGTGEQAYKRVINTFKHEDKEVMLVEFVQMETWKNDVYKSNIPYSAVPYEHKQFLVTTPNHPFWIKGVGWSAAGTLTPHDSNAVTLELASGAPILLTEAGPLYQTPLAPGKIWFMDPEMHELGVVPVDYRYGELQADTHGGYEPSPDINMGCWSSEIMAREGALHQTVYNIEVEDWHTYYVGKFGIWVHNANCGEVTSSAQVKAVYDKLDAEGIKALPSEKDLNALQPPHNGLTFAEQGMYLGNKPTSFQQATNGAKWIQEGSRVTFAEPVLRMDVAKFNAEFGTRVQQNFVQGDALARMPGQVDGYSKTIIEASSNNSKFVKGPTDNLSFVDKDGIPVILNYLKAKSFALRENPSFSWVLEIEGRAGYEMVRDYIEKNVAGQSWFSKDFYLAHAEPLVDGALERQLADNLTGFAKSVDAAGNEIWSAVDVNKLDVLRSLDDGSPTANYVPNPANYLEVPAEGNASGLALLAASDVQQLLSAAKQYWLNAGALSSVLDGIQFNIGQLPTQLRRKRNTTRSLSPPTAQVGAGSWILRRRIRLSLSTLTAHNGSLRRIALPAANSICLL